jgi:CubicO group peptidase (beta-lactamase class C family)
MILLQIIFWCLALVYGFHNFGALIRGQAISAFQIWSMTIGVVGLLVMRSLDLL